MPKEKQTQILKLSFAAGRMAEQLGQEFHNKVVAIAELVNNSIDAGATVCKVTFANPEGKNPGFIRIADNGCGMSMVVLQTQFAKIGYSSGEHDSAKIGKKGTGKTAALSLGHSVTVSTKTPDSDTVHEFNWGDRQIKDAYYNESIDVPLTIRPVNEEEDPESPSFTTVFMSPLKTTFNEADIREQLPRHIHRRHECLIMVNDLPLLPYQPQGQRIEFTKAYPGIGDVEVNLVVCENTPPAGETVMMCAVRDVMPLSEFYRQLPRMRDEYFPSVFRTRGGLVVGFIDIPYLNQKYAALSRSKFSSELFNQTLTEPKSDLRRICDMLKYDVAPLVEKALGVIEQSIELEEDRRLLNEIVEEIGYVPEGELIGGFQVRRQQSRKRPKPKEGIASVSLHPRSSEVEVGATVEFRIPKKYFKRPVWQSTGGTIETTAYEPWRAVYTAGSAVGEFAVKVFEKDGDEFLAGKVVIVEETRFSVSPRKVTLSPGQVQLFSVRKKSKKAGTIIWPDVSASGGTLNANQGDAVVYTAGNKPGDYILTAMDSRPQSMVSASAKILIEADEADGDGPGKKYVFLKGMYFEIDLLPVFQKPACYFDLSVQAREGCFTLTVNKLHPRWNAADSRKSQKLYVKDILSLAVSLADKVNNSQTDEAQLVEEFIDSSALLAVEMHRRS